MLGDGFDSGLAAQLFVVLQLEIIVFGVKDDELADSVEIDDGNEIRDQRILGLPYERFAVRRRASPLRPIDQVNEFLMPDLLIWFSQRHRQRQKADWLLQLVIQDLGTNRLPYQLKAVCAEHTEAVQIIQRAAVCNIGIQRFQQKLLAGVELGVEFLDNSFQNIILIAECFKLLVGKIGA